MLLLLQVPVAVLGVLMFSGLLSLGSMLVAGGVVAFIWWFASVVVILRERHRAPVGN